MNLREAKFIERIDTEFVVSSSGTQCRIVPCTERLKADFRAPVLLDPLRPLLIPMDCLL